MAASFLSPHKEGVVVTVWVVPGSKKTTLAGLYGDFLKVKVTEPPESGRANKMVLSFLAGLCGIPAADALLLSGASSRNKRILLKNASIDVVSDKLRADGTGG